MKNFYCLLLFIFLIFPTCIFAQDIIKKTDGSSISAKVLDITPTDIKYKRFTNPDGPTYTVPVNDVESITYPSGDVDKFAKSNTNQNPVNNVNSTPLNNMNQNPVNNDVIPQTIDNYQSQPQNQQVYNNNQNVNTNVKYNLNHKVIHSDFIKIKSESNKERIEKMILELNKAIESNDIDKAWRINTDIESLNN